MLEDKFKEILLIVRDEGVARGVIQTEILTGLSYKAILRSMGFAVEQNSLIVEFKSFNSMVDYLKNNFYTTDFKNSHTRPQLATMLRRLFPSTTPNRPQRAFSSMCKERQCKHIEFWLKLHGERCKPMEQ